MNARKIFFPYLNWIPVQDVNQRSVLFFFFFFLMYPFNSRDAPLQTCVIEKVCLGNRCGLWLDVPGQMVCIRASRSPEASFLTPAWRTSLFSYTESQKQQAKNSQKSGHNPYWNGLSPKRNKRENGRVALDFKFHFSSYMNISNSCFIKHFISFYVSSCKRLAVVE